MWRLMILGDRDQWKIQMNTHILPQFSKIKPENVEAEFTSCFTQSRQEIDSLLNQP